MGPLIKNLILALVLGLIGYLGYALFIKNDDPIVSADPNLNQAIRDGQDFLSRIRQLDSMKLDAALLDDRRFESLIDFSVPLQPEETGRTNPFDPLPGS